MTNCVHKSRLTQTIIECSKNISNLLGVGGGKKILGKGGRGCQLTWGGCGWKERWVSYLGCGYVAWGRCFAFAMQVFILGL